MTKKLLITLSILTLFANATKASDNNSATHDEGVVINGIRWATRNVDMPGTFAETPESFGMLFQWNRRKGWNATDERVTGWNGSFITDEEWEKENDPCPQGWRVPTREELEKLTDTENEWTTRNGVMGRLFGVVPYQIFLPSTIGRRIGRSGILSDIGFVSHYWSSTSFPIDNRAATTLWFFMKYADYMEYDIEIPGFFGSSKSDGNSVRCVAK